MVIHHNVYMHQGISGIPEILSKDSYQGFFDKQNASSPLAGGRYRPLSIVTFAIEQDVFSSAEYLAVATDCKY
jgi:protein O-mannosyl-transferase